MKILDIYCSPSLCAAVEAPSAGTPCAPPSAEVRIHLLYCGKIGNWVKYESGQVHKDLKTKKIASKILFGKIEKINKKSLENSEVIQQVSI